MSTKHTNWHVSKDGVHFSVWVGSEHFQPNAEQAGVGHAIGIAKVWKREHADQIVHAVNTHAELVAALRGLVSLANDPAGSSFTLREVFGTFQHGTGKPEIEGAKALAALSNGKC